MYLARPRRSTRSATVCIKVSARIDGWLREAYFGHLLDGHPRAIRVSTRFRCPRARRAGALCLALEYAPHGDLSAFLHAQAGAGRKRRPAGRSPASSRCSASCTAARCCTATSRRSTFSFARARLKLGDFGIVQQQSDRRGITARTMNALTAPSDILAGAAPKWQARMTCIRSAS